MLSLNIVVYLLLCTYSDDAVGSHGYLSQQEKQNERRLDGFKKEWGISIAAQQLQ